MLMEQDLGRQRDDELPMSEKMNRHASVHPAIIQVCAGEPWVL
jgi:hypothetical protein